MTDRRDVVRWVLGAVLFCWASYRALWLPLTTKALVTHTELGGMGQDYRDAVYLPVREFNAGGDPYLPANMFDRWGAVQEFDLYGPQHLLLHAPLGLMSIMDSWRVYVLLLWLALIACLCLATLALGATRPSAVLLAVGVGLMTEPAKVAIWYGNVNPLVWLGAVVALTKARSHPAWLLWAMPLLWIKPQYGLPVTAAVWALGWGRAAARGMAVAILTALPAAVILLVREGGFDGLFSVVQENLRYAQSTDYGRVESETTSRIDGYALAHAAGLPLPAGEYVVTAVVLTVLVALLVLVRRRQLHVRSPVAILIVTATYLSLVHSQGEEFLLVLGVFSGLLAVSSRSTGHSDRDLGGTMPLAATLLGLACCLLPLVLVTPAQEFVISQFDRGALRLLTSVSLALGFSSAALAIALTSFNGNRAGRPAQPEGTPYHVVWRC